MRVLSRFATWIAGAGLVCLLAVAPVAAATAAGEISSYTLGSGDRVRVTVFGERELSGEFEVSAEQTLAMPLIGNVRAGGKTVRQLEREIERKLLEGYLKAPQVSAEVTNYRPFYILGEVKNPGSYPFVNNMNVMNAVAMGGGFTHRALKGDVFLSRAGELESKERKVPSTTMVMPGDVIRVSERFF